MLRLLFFTLLCCATAVAQAESSADQAFFVLANDYIDHVYFPSNPTIATQMGVHAYDGELESYSKAGMQKDIALLKQYEKRFSQIQPAELSRQAEGDYELVLNQIRSKLLTLEVIKPWENNPDYYSSGITNSAFVILARKYAAPEKRIEYLIEREKLMLGVLADARANLKNPPKISTEIALEQLPGIIHFFENDIPAGFVGIKDKKLQLAFQTSNAKVIAALREYQVWLQHHLLVHSQGDFRLGEATFRKLLLYNEMIDLPLDKLIAINKADIEHNQAEFLRLAAEMYPGKSKDEVLAILGSNHPDPKNLLTAFSDTFDYLIRFIKEKHIITIPSDVRPIMEETPPFLRAITFASMDIPGPFEKVGKEAYFNVTLPAKEWPKQRTENYMRAFSYPLVSDIAVHEAYPGHYVQFLWIQNIQDPVRRVFGSSSNAEGWAHYAEQMMLDEGYGGTDAKKLRLGQLIEALLRNARFVVGIQMHRGQMSFDEAIKFFVEEGYQSQEAGLVETKRGTADPLYLYYTLGKLEILKLRHDVEIKEGKNFNLQKFHDDFMKQGFPPIKIVRQALLGNDSPVL